MKVQLLQQHVLVLVVVILAVNANPTAAFAPSSSNLISSLLPDVAPARSLYSAKSDVSDALPSSTDESSVNELVVEPLGLSTQQSAQTVAYRASLLGATAAYGLQIVLPALQDAGLSIDSVDGTASIVATACVVAACALAPKAGKKVMLVDGKVLAASVATAIAAQPLVGLAALFAREIYYFGVPYKVEAALGLAASLAVLLLPDVVPLQASNAATCLALAVLVFGKFLEPLEEDWQPNQSEFLASDEMK